MSSQTHVSQQPADPIRPAAVIVLAAGEGTRMKSTTPKVLHELCGRSLLGHALAAAADVNPERIAVVVRHERDRVAEHVAKILPQALIVDQDQVKGTGRAVQCALAELGELHGSVVVTYGDVPLLTAQTLRGLLNVHAEQGNAVTVLTAELADPTGYGRIIRAATEGAEITGIVEHRDATAEQLLIAEINSGIYVFSAQALSAALPQLQANNDQAELYLTDVLGLARAAGGRVAACTTPDIWQTAGVNDRVQLAEMAAELNRRVLRDAMLAGVTIVDPGSTWIDVQVKLGTDITILPGTQLYGDCTIANSAVIGPDCTLRAVTIGAGATVIRTHAVESEIGPGAQVGPFAYLRPGSILGAAAKVGTFVETKNSQLGAGAKVPHLSYVGDATIGEHSNIGAASVFVNYDGVRKSRTVIGAHCRTGSDNMFVAPVTVGDGAYSGAGTVIRSDVPPGALAISVAPQRNIPGWTQANRPGTESANAADLAQHQSTEGTPPA